MEVTIVTSIIDPATNFVCTETQNIAENSHMKDPSYVVSNNFSQPTFNMANIAAILKMLRLPEFNHFRIYHYEILCTLRMQYEEHQNILLS